MSVPLGDAAFSGGVYRQRYLLRAQDVDVRRMLRTARLLEMLQEAAIAHTEHVGMGREKTLDAGALWVVAAQHIEADRWPLYDERITVESWPGEMQHVLFPRVARVLDEAGRELIRASALWLLMDARTRRMAFPARLGVNVEGVAHGPRIALPEPIPRPKGAPCARDANGARRAIGADGAGGVAAFGTRESVGEANGAAHAGSGTFAVPYSYCDLNGHMNNVRYLDLAEDMLEAPSRGIRFCKLDADFEGEAPRGARLELTWTESESGASVRAVNPAQDGARPVFQLAMAY